MKRLDDYWYRKSPWLLLLWPVSLLFCLLVFIRRLLYRYDLLKSYAMPVPVIVVGNISVGGSGKTPLVLWLVEHLKQRGYRPGIVSRGYGGAAETWPQSVSADSDPAMVGDEPLLLVRRSGCPMVVAPNRVAAAERLLAQNDVDVIISDDGLQHYRLRRDIEIAVVDGERRFGNGLCLPAGPLREPKRRSSEVDFIVCNGGDAGDAGDAEWLMTLHGEQACPLQGGACRTLNEFSDGALHAVAGIGNPQRFFDSLREQGLEVLPHPFNDHHSYAKGQLDFADGREVLMTEKDAVKYFHYSSERHWYVPVTATLADEFARQLDAALERADG